MVQDHRRETVASLGQAGPRFAAPEALGAVGAGERAWGVAALFAPPATLSLGSSSDLGSPPNTLARKAARGQRRPGPRPEPDGAAGLGSRSKAVARTPFLKTLDFFQDLSSPKQLQEGSASFRRNPLCGSPLLVSLEPSPSSPLQIHHPPQVAGPAG